MSVFVVTWNLNKEGSAYHTARAAFLKQLGNYNFVQNPGLDTVAWVQSSSTAQVVADNLRHALDDNDQIFVSEVTRGHHWGWLSESTWEWISARL